MNESTFVTGTAATAHAGEDHRDFAAPLGGTTTGRLEINHGITKAVLRTDAAMPDLIRAHFEGPTPRIEERDGAVTIRYPRFAPVDWLRFGLLDRHAADVILNASIPWEIAVAGGITKLSADLRAIRLTRFDIDGGASEIELTLPAPVGIVPVRIGGGASKVTLHRPAGVPVRLQIKGGASDLALDDQRFGAVGGETRLTSRHDPNAADRYEITIGGGASGLTID
jgi:hypothetical protein